jgi:hypothetical protein
MNRLEPIPPAFRIDQFRPDRDGRCGLDRRDTTRRDTNPTLAKNRRRGVAASLALVNE